MKPVIAGIIGTLGLSVAAALSYVTAANYFFNVGKVGNAFQAIVPLNFEWLRFTDKLHIDLGILLDPISVMMLVVIDRKSVV